MQPLAIFTVVLAVAMLAGVLVALIRVRRGHMRGAERFNSWNRYGSIPLAGAGLALGVISRIGTGQTSATHEIMFAVTTALLLSALLCALAGAAAATRRRPDSSQA
jgi:cytochrome bd-type quinol oxidase subunit 2